MTAHRLLSSAMHIDDDIDRPVHSLMLTIHDLRGLPVRRQPSAVPSSLIFGSAYSRYGRIMITRDAWRLTLKVPDVRRRHWPVAIRLHKFWNKHLLKTDNFGHYFKEKIVGTTLNAALPVSGSDWLKDQSLLHNTKPTNWWGHSKHRSTHLENLCRP